MIVTIHQPEHLPWLGFFHKASHADIFVVLDNVQFRKNYFQNRNKVRTHDGSSWITVPVSRDLDTEIKGVKITPEARWKEKWWNAVSLAYARSAHFSAYENQLKSAIESATDSLCDLNVALLKFVFRALHINSQILIASQLGTQGKGSDIILDICRKVKADGYLSGISGRDYLKLDEFKEAGIRVDFQEFHHPVYKQLYEPFMPCMSVIDLLFNYGPDSLNIINGKGVTVMQELFL